MAFRIGQRVRMTAEALQQFSQRRVGSNRGKVVSNYGWPHFVRVRPDGLKTVSTYAVEFWESDADD